MKTLTPTADEPRLSSNQLAEYLFASAARKRTILQNAKYPNAICSPYYSDAQRGVLRSLEGSAFSSSKLAAEIERIQGIEPKSRHQATKHANNIQAVRSFAELMHLTDPPEGTHEIIRRNALFRMEGVTISARPEIVTTNRKQGTVAYTKLRFSKSKVSADAQEIVLLILLHYGQAQVSGGLRFSLEQTRLIDCYSKTLVYGHQIGRHRYQQLHLGLAEIRRVWPTIAPVHAN